MGEDEGEEDSKKRQATDEKREIYSVITFNKSGINSVSKKGSPFTPVEGGKTFFRKF